MRLSPFLLLLILLSASVSYGQNALDLDGTNDYVQTSYPGVSGNGARTVEAWIKTTANANPNNGGVQQIILDWGTFVTGGRFTFCVLWNDAIRLEVSGSGVSGNIAVNDGNWHHVAGVYDPNAVNKVSLYVDGVLDVAGNFTVTTNTVPSINARIGQRVDGARHFDGSIDEVKIWNIARSQADISAERNTEVCNLLPGLQAYYNFNEGTAGGSNTGITTLPDQSGNNYAGSLNNFALSGTSSNWVSGASLGSGVNFTEATIIACDSFFWAADSMTYVTSGIRTATLSNAAGCDSIVELEMRIFPSDRIEILEETCSSYFWDETGVTYTKSGSYPVSYTNANQCDSTVVLILTINQIDSTQETVSACDAYLWPSDSTTYTESGNYTALFTNSKGCDSLVKLALTIDTVNTMVDHDGSATLTAMQGMATYQWLACDSGFAPIPGASSQSFEATENGSYAVEIQSGSCTDTSACVDVLTISIEAQHGLPWKVFPNPNNGQFTVLLDKQTQQLDIRLLNVMGQEVYQASYRHTQQATVRPNLERGVYMMFVQTAEGTSQVFQLMVDE